MIIKVIPENDKDREITGEAEFHNVNSFFIIGVHRDSDGDLKDFHSWHGNHRYLCSNLGYFLEILHDERRLNDEKERTADLIASDRGPRMIRHGGVSQPNLKVVELGDEVTDVTEGGAEAEISEVVEENKED